MLSVPPPDSITTVSHRQYSPPGDRYLAYRPENFQIFFPPPYVARVTPESGTCSQGGGERKFALGLGKTPSICLAVPRGGNIVGD